jgi:hypothetical protein
MGSLKINGRQIFLLTENDRYPSPTINSPPMFALREDEEGNFWVYFQLKGRWPLIADTPFETQGKAVEAAMEFDYCKLFK